MVDRFSPEVRSAMMARIRGNGTKPEIAVRRLLHAMGYRFRLYRRDLPGSPDVVLPKLRLCIFVHGCFWHQHPGCPRAQRPSSNRDFWDKKLVANTVRDERVVRELAALAWRTATIWECKTRVPTTLEQALREILAIMAMQDRIGRSERTDSNALADLESRKP